MGVKRYRSIEAVPPAWREKDDPENLRLVAQAMEPYYRWKPMSETKRSKVERFRSIEEMNAGRDDPYRCVPTTEQEGGALLEVYSSASSSPEMRAEMESTES